MKSLVALLPRIDKYDDRVGDAGVARGVGGNRSGGTAPASAFLTDLERPLWARVTAASSLAKIGQAHPESRAECIAALTKRP